MLKFLLIFLLGVSVLKAQSLDKARSIIDTLCSQEMFGRGYTKEGHQKAANYQQTFPLKVNTFPNPISFRLDQKELSLGKDYIIAPASKSFNGKLEVEQLPLKALRSIKKLKKFLAKHAGQKALLIDFRELNKEERKLASQLSSSFVGYPVVLMVDSVKLTASMSQ
jgi:aminopeptidase YwaD